MNPSSADDKASNWAPLVSRFQVQAFAWAAVTLASVALEILRWLDPEQRQQALGGRIFDGAEDYAPFLPILLAAPLIWHWPSRGRNPLSTAQPEPTTPQGSTFAAAIASILVAAVAFAASATFGWPFRGMPPVFHDEYSYLFQAETFLHGRTSYRSFEPMPELFDQMHVLNEGKFASRYFPGAGAWIAPFLSIGHPYWGYWLAQAILCGGLVWIGRLLSGLRVGIAAGLLAAVSPGLLTFSNLLLAHHPTLVGLTVFLGAILKCRQKPSVALAAIAGAGLTFAMLCRPMTAAGFALPFGVDWLIRLLRKAPRTNSQPTFLQTCALGAPLCAGFAILLAYNHAITGQAFLSPYQQYTDIYSPRHVYGFDNVRRGEQHLGPKVIDNYDRWAQNLTPALALRNVAVRTITSLRGTLGVIPLIFAAAVMLLDWRRLSAAWKLIIASIISLHVVHIPYWYDGIMGWHYVFETAPLWLLLFAEATRRLFAIWNDWQAPRLRWWWSGLIATALLVNLLSINPLWRSRCAFAQSEAAFARTRYADFRDTANQLAQRGPIIVFVEPDPGDRHIDYVTNPPTLQGPVLVARYVAGKTDLDAAIRLFPDRHPYLFRPATREWRDLNAGPVQ